MLNSLRIQRDVVVMESFLSVDLSGLLKNTFPAMLSELSGFVSKFVPDQPAITLTSKQHEFVKEVSKHPYLDIAPFAAFVPEGLDVTYYKYAERLTPAVEHATKSTIAQLSSYTVFLSQLINNAETKLGTVAFTKPYQEIERARAGLNQKLGECFKRGSTKTDVTIGTVVDRNADWVSVFQHSDALVQSVNRVDRKMLNKKVAECGQLLNTVMELIRNNKLEGISPQAVNNLADGTYQVACELEFYAAVHYKVLAYAESINRTVKNFQDKFVK